MAEFLNHLIPRHFPDLVFRCITHEGKKDLQKSLPRKARAWAEPNDHFVVLMDCDSVPDCIGLKNDLLKLCEGCCCRVTVRIVCQELEAWFLGQPETLAFCFDSFPSDISGKAKFRDPDRLQKPSKELSRLLPRYRKLLGAQVMGKAMSLGGTSTSYQVFLRTLAQISAPSE